MFHGYDTEHYRKLGNAGTAGVLYQLGILEIGLLNCMEKDEWRISLENLDADKLDDLVVESSEGNIFLQAKHEDETSTKISLHNLLSAEFSGNFGLPKYFFSCIKILNSQKLRNGNIKNVIIVTNNDLSDEVKNEIYTEGRNLATGDLLYYKGTKDTAYTFKSNIVELLKPKIVSYYQNVLKGNVSRDVEKQITDENIERYISCVLFIPNFPKEGKLETVIKKVLSKCKYAQKLDKSAVYNFIHNKIEAWFKHKKGTYLTKNDVKAFFCEIRTNEYCGKFDKVDISFEKNTLPVEDSEKRLWHVVPQQNYIVNVLKLYRTLQSRNEKEFLLISNDFDDEIKEIMVDAFKLPTYVYLIIVCEDYDDFFTEEVCGKLKDILHTFNYKKCVLVCEEGNKIAEYFKESSLYEVVEEEIKYEDIERESREGILYKNFVEFQGKETSLVELLGSFTQEDFVEYVDPEMLVSFVRGEKIKVGSKVDELTEEVKNYYIHRNFNTDEESIPEEEMCQLDRHDQKVVLISDSPGMGKSTVLTYVAGVLKENYPNLWVIKIDINDYTQLLWEYRENGIKTVTVPQLLASHEETKIKSALEKKLFMIPSKVLLLIDGMDEIIPDYKELVLGLIKNCENEWNFAKVYVTMRSHLGDELEGEFGVEAFSLSVFSQDDQVEFLKKYWMVHLRLKKSIQVKRCEAYAEKLVRGMSDWIKERESNMLAQIPLQTRVIAEVFQEKCPANDGLGVWEGCQEFVAGKGETPKLPKEINLVELYWLFMLKKRFIFLNDRSKSGGKIISKGAVVKAYQESVQYHRRLALEVVLSKDEASSMQYYQNIVQIRPDEEYIVKLGNVLKVNGGYKFAHRTFAEYHAAKCLVEELNYKTLDERFLNFFVDRVLSSWETDVVRSFLNGFLSDELESLPEETFNAFARLDYTERLYNGDNTFLHTLIEQALAHLFRFAFRCVYLAGESQGIDRIRQRSGKTLLHYAARHLPDVVGLLLEHGANVNIEDFDGNTPLHDSVLENRVESAKLLLDSGADIDAKDELKKTAIFGPVEVSCLQMVDLFLGRGADIGVVNERGQTLLHVACRRDSVEVVEALLKAGASVNSKLPKGSTPLHEACQWSEEAVGPLLRYGADPNVPTLDEGLTPVHVSATWGAVNVFEQLIQAGGDVNIRDKEGRLPLHWAAISIQSNREEVLRFLLDRCGVDERDGKSNTALHLAAREDCLSSAEILIEAGANVNAENYYGVTPLCNCVFKDGAKVAKLLLESGAEVIGRGNRVRTFIYLAIRSCDLRMLELLLEKAVEVGMVDEKGRTLLHEACCRWQQGSAKVIGRILKKAATMNGMEPFLRYDPNLADNKGLTPVHVCAHMGPLDILEQLVKAGGDVNVRDRDGRLALHWAALGRHREDLLRYLVEKCDDCEISALSLLLGVDARDNKSCTALHLAARAGGLYTLTSLVEMGANTDIQDSEGRTALDRARDNGFSDMMRFLENPFSLEPSV